MMYIDPCLIVKCFHVVCAHKVDGDGAADGRYAICLVLAIGGKTRREYADYRTAVERDAAFIALGDAIRAQQAMLEAYATDDDEEED